MESRVLKLKKKYYYALGVDCKIVVKVNNKCNKIKAKKGRKIGSCFRSFSMTRSIG